MICAVAIFWIVPRNDFSAPKKTTVLSLWNVDTFEGGKGSRPSFLGKIAARFEKENDGVLIMVSAKTPSGAKAAMEKGEVPDLLSFGSYFSCGTPLVEPSVWCQGGYALYSFSEDFSKANASNTVLSLGGNNQPLVAAALYGFSGVLFVEDSTTAYVKFLNGEYEYLLGTQRDACRFVSRGVAVKMRALGEFSDLKQYIAPLKEENKKLANAFIEYLLAETSQKLVVEIGMLSAKYDIYGDDAPLQNALEAEKRLYTTSPFMDESASEEMKNAALSVLHGSNKELLKNFLKRS